MIDQPRTGPDRGRSLVGLVASLLIAGSGCGGRAPSAAPTTAAPVTSRCDIWDDDRDQRLVEQIRQAIDADRTIGAEAPRIAIAARSGRVRLSGTVGSAVIKAQAGVVASWLLGIAGVDDDLQVTGPAATPANLGLQ